MITKRTIRKFKVALMAAILTPVGVLLIAGAATAIPTENEPSLRDIYEQRINWHDGWRDELTAPVQVTINPMASRQDATLLMAYGEEGNPQTPEMTCADIGGLWNEDKQACIAELPEIDGLCEGIGGTMRDGECHTTDNPVIQPRDICEDLGFAWSGSECLPPITAGSGDGSGGGLISVGVAKRNTSGVIVYAENRHTGNRCRLTTYPEETHGTRYNPMPYDEGNCPESPDAKQSDTLATGSRSDNTWTHFPDMCPWGGSSPRYVNHSHYCIRDYGDGPQKVVCGSGGQSDSGNSYFDYLWECFREAEELSGEEICEMLGYSWDGSQCAIGGGGTIISTGVATDYPVSIRAHKEGENSCTPKYSERECSGGLGGDCWYSGVTSGYCPTPSDTSTVSNIRLIARQMAGTQSGESSFRVDNACPWGGSPQVTQASPPTCTTWFNDGAGGQECGNWTGGNYRWQCTN